MTNTEKTISLTRINYNDYTLRVCENNFGKYISNLTLSDLKRIKDLCNCVEESLEKS